VAMRLVCSLFFTLQRPAAPALLNRQEVGAGGARHPLKLQLDGDSTCAVW
jgi:hypothetical protein